jgi:hypothetical protein
MWMKRKSMVEANEVEEQWIVDRANLREMMGKRDGWTNERMAEESGKSVGWVKKWKKRLKAAGEGDEQVLRGYSRRRKKLPEGWSEEVMERIKEIRHNPPENLGRVPGPKTILYYLGRDAGLKAVGVRLPKSTRTVWKLLWRTGCYTPRVEGEREPVERPAPMMAWEMDFKDVSSVPCEPDGKRGHTVEVLNIVDSGTSSLVDTQAHSAYCAETALAAVATTLRQQGCPDSLRFDRDPRFVGSQQGSDFPSALIRFLLCLGVQPIVCPPRRPDKNPFVERYHRTYEQECLMRYLPHSLEAVQSINLIFQQHYNFERPNQAISCGNRPPRTAFPVLPTLPSLPEQVDPNRWLLPLHGKLLKRRISANGSIQVGKYHYYVQQSLKAHYVVLKVDACNHEFLVLLHNSLIKTLPIKGLYSGGEISFDEFLQVMVKEARSEWQSYLRRMWRNKQVASATM